MNYPPEPRRDQPPPKSPRLSGKRWFDVFVAGSIDPMIIFDESLTLKFVNESAAQLFGKKPSELIGINIEACGTIGSIIAPILFEVSKTKVGASCDHEMPEEEQPRVFQGTYSPVSDTNGKMLGIFSILREVTDRRIALRQLAASNTRLRAQAKALEAFDIVSESDLSGEILYVNDRFCAVSKYSRSELIGKNYRLLNSGYHSKAFFQELWQTISRGQPWFGELKNRAKDNSTFWVQTILTPILNDDGTIARFLSIQQDITRERNERFKVAGSSLQFRQILDSNPLLEASVDLDQNIVFCNTALLKATGYGEQEVVEKNWFHTFVPLDEKRVIQAAFLKLLSGTTNIVEFSSQMLGKDGRGQEVAWRATVIRDLEHVAYGIHLLGEPGPQARPAPDLLRNDTIGFVAHELKGGLVSIESGLQLIQGELDADELDRMHLKSIVTKLFGKVAHIDDLTRRVMDTLERGSRNVEIHTQPVSLRTVLSGVWARMKEENKASGPFTFQLQIPDEDIVVQWDPLRIEQVERNLLSNAVQYSKPGGGRITLSARLVKDHVLVGVADEGIGVPPESVESMFDLFRRGTNAESQKAEHFGIGLKLCRNIVSQHRGRIWIESKLDVGTTVFLLLPIDPRIHPIT